MPTLFMLVGLPATGKSTWLKSIGVDGENTTRPNTVHVSSDWHVENLCKKFNLTYSEGFDRFIARATEEMNGSLEIAVHGGYDVFWDQTNLSKKSRSRKFNQFDKIENSDTYRRVAVYFTPPYDWRNRLDSRPGKNIPRNVLNSMMSSRQAPVLDEGFNAVYEWPFDASKIVLELTR